MRPELVVFFDDLAKRWDQMMDLPALEARLEEGLRELGPGLLDGEILDVGCGTGNLSRALAALANGRGQVTAIDPSSEMLRIAEAKLKQSPVRLLHADLESFADREEERAKYDLVLCYSVWPHFEARKRAKQAILHLLAPGGHVLVWHTSSREEITAIHRSVGDPIGDHSTRARD
ncbi:MAG: class I SAM-dependent methyltransferase [Myxococcales bacterium]|nr:class I SAM-dependent methyltransferase [Myxococcales bacterium]